MSRRKRISSPSFINGGKPPKKRGFKKILMAILALVIVGIGGFSAYTFFNFSSSAQKGYKNVDYLKEVDPNFKKF